MTNQNKLPTITRDANIYDALEVIQKGGCHMAVITTEDDTLQGVITDGDIRRAILRGLTLEDNVADIMNTKPIVAHQDAGNEEALKLMEQYSLTAIPVVDSNNCLVAIDTIHEHIAPITASAVIMAGGKGMRLRPLTETTPKPMMLVGDRPLIERTVEKLAGIGVDRIHVAVNYLGDKIRGHLGDGSDFGTSLHYLEEQDMLGTAGALSLLPPGQEAPLLVLNGDIFTNFDFSRMLVFHREEKSALTVGVAEYHIQIPYGVVSVDNGHVVGLVEKPSQRIPINAGIYVIEPSVLSHIPRDTHFNMTDLIEALLKAGEKVSPFLIHEQWMDIGTPSDLQQARDLADGS